MKTTYAAMNTQELTESVMANVAIDPRPKKQGQIAVQAHLLDKAISELKDSIDHLESDLAHVVRASVAPPPTAPQEVESLVPVADFLRTCGTRICDLNLRIKGIRERIES